MLGLKEQIFGHKGFSTDLRMSSDELEVFRAIVSQHWLDTIGEAYPDCKAEASELGLPNYHHLTDRIDHRKLWPKSSRVLPQPLVDVIKKLPFLSALRLEFGEFSISDIYDTYQHHGKEEIYWRLVRPDSDADVGPLHTDKWFHSSFNSGRGMFAPGVSTVKLWIPLHCEPGKNGLMIVKGSHLKEWKYHVEEIDGQPKPLPDDDLSEAGAELVFTEPGNIILFHENTLHGGSVNRGKQTRVSAEITMVLPAPMES